ncbi:MAG: TniQ family protein [Bosea sp.]|uniref:TniQ family protein n=1 Tax=Bosea sp. (in: a-proteobacteria) TaxID=1871050 RepID=UPI001E02AABA|nr:TniQ family protein [Beijerinckiaceae bacterium]MCP4564131.1 TniQ family protein [Bosea sp. (in: a-proteobacteria)]MCP4739915.1 TniQ family protein [Bosea sp. (in: a-proteobacteria)]
MKPAPCEITLQPRYRSAPSGRWPIMVAPRPDEWLPGWLIRFGAANGLPARALGTLLNLGAGNWALNNEFGLPQAIARDVETASGLSAALLPTLGRPKTDRILMLAPRVNVAASVAGRRQATWLQLCPQCLDEDESPFLRRDWRLATTLICERHGRQLIDRCPVCRQGFAVCDAASLSPFITCTTCGVDLRPAAGQRLGASSLRIALTLEHAGRLADPDHRAKILALPQELDPPISRPLTQLSVMMRIRCLTFARQRILALASTQSPTPGGSSRANLHDLLAIYAGVASRPHAQSAARRSAASKA